MKIPLIVHLGAGAQALPVVAYFASRGRTRSAAAIALGCVVSIGADLISLVMRTRAGTNHIVTYLSAPLFAVLLLAGLREWQLTTRERKVFLGVIFAFLLAALVLIGFIEDLGNFNFSIGPIYSLLLLVGGLWTLIRRAGAVEVSPLLANDWFWVALGLAMYGASTALASPIGGYLMNQGRPDLVNFAWEVRAGCVLASLSLVSYGVFRGPMVSKFSTLGQSETEIV